MIPMNQNAFRQAAIQGTAPVLVMYTASWCGYCQRLQPILAKLSREYTGEITFGTVDIDLESGLALQEQIEVVPTLVLYHGGNVLGSIVVPECGSQVESLLRESLKAG